MKCYSQLPLMETMTELDLTVGASAPAIPTLYSRFKCHSTPNSTSIYRQVALIQLHTITQLAIITKKWIPAGKTQMTLQAKVEHLHAQ